MTPVNAETLAICRAISSYSAGSADRHGRLKVAAELRGELGGHRVGHATQLSHRHSAPGLVCFGPDLRGRVTRLFSMPIGFIVRMNASRVPHAR